MDRNGKPNERRRSNRVQGGFNQGTKFSPPARAAAAASNPGDNDQQAATTSPQFPGKGGSPHQPSLHSPLLFQQVECQTLPEKPELRTIEEEGEHTLSDGPSGKSWVYFDPTFLDEEMETLAYNKLLDEIAWQETSVTIAGQQHACPRLVKWFGPLNYSYSKVLLKADDDWHPTVRSILEAVQSKTKSEYNSVLLNLYRHEKHSVDWHSDDELSMGVGSTIASVSLGETRKFELRKKPPPSEGWNYECMPHVRLMLIGGSLVVMDGATQQDWQHRVPKEYHSRRPRINLTFRTIFSSEQKLKYYNTSC